jgi:hypothetical protein
MGKVEHRFAGRCPRWQSRATMQRVKPVEAGAYEWRGRCVSDERKTVAEPLAEDIEEDGCAS